MAHASRLGQKLTQFYYYNERKTLPVKISNTLQVGKKNYEHFLIRIYLKFFQLKHVKTEIICFFNIILQGLRVAQAAVTERWP